jgi:hypothetical protein
MKISEFRPKLKAWLSKYLTINKWEIDYPLVPTETLGMLPPLTNVRYYIANNIFYGEATQDISIIQRADEQLTYDDLPHGVFSGRYASLCMKLLKEYKDIDLDIISVLIPSANPVTVTERDDARGDWFILTKWNLVMTWLAEVETFVAVEPIITFNTIGVGLNRAYIPKTPEDAPNIILPVNKTLDQTLNINRP